MSFPLQEKSIANIGNCQHIIILFPRLHCVTKYCCPRPGLPGAGLTLGAGRVPSRWKRGYSLLVLALPLIREHLRRSCALFVFPVETGIHGVLARG